MPGPAIYVAVAVGTVAVAIVLKAFVYDQHFRPKIAAWREGVNSPRRRRARPYSHGVSTSSSPPPRDHDGSGRSPQQGQKGKKFKRSAESSVSSHIELQHLIESEIESFNGSEGDNTGIRHRRVGESQKSRDHLLGDDSGHILGSSSSPSLASLDGLSISDEILTKNRLSERVVPSSSSPFSIGTHSQNSNQVVQQGDLSRSGITSPGPLGLPDSQTPVLVGTRSASVMSPISGTGDFPTPTTMMFGVPENPRQHLDTDLLSQSDTLSSDRYLSPNDPAVSPGNIHSNVSPALSPTLSIEFLSSPSFSPPGSPFVDAGLYHSLMGSPAGAISQRGDIHLSGVMPSSPGGTRAGPGPLPAVNRDIDIFSLPSQVSSDMSSDDGDYDGASILDSELSSWMSDVADGEGAPQH